MQRCEQAQLVNAQECYVTLRIYLLYQQMVMFTENVIVTVGSSTLSGGNASTVFTSQIVSEIFSSPRPVIAMMSPAPADSA